jgi:hypothetical protein
VVQVAVGDRGHPGTRGIALAAPLGIALDVAPAYCTLGSATAVAR